MGHGSCCCTRQGPYADSEKKLQWRDAVVVNGGGYQAVRAAVASKRKPGERGPQISPTKQLVSLRYSPEVLAYFKSSGAGWQTRMDEALKQWVASHAGVGTRHTAELTNRGKA